jgi:hypothetical protein
MTSARSRNAGCQRLRHLTTSHAEPQQVCSRWSEVYSRLEAAPGSMILRCDLVLAHAGPGRAEPRCRSVGPSGDAVGFTECPVSEVHLGVLDAREWGSLAGCGGASGRRGALVSRRAAWEAAAGHGPAPLRRGFRLCLPASGLALSLKGRFSGGRTVLRGARSRRDRACSFQFPG